MQHINHHGFPVIDPPGPPTFITLVREWIREDPILNCHIHLVDWTEGTYVQTNCKAPQRKLEYGYTLALFPNGEWYAPAGTGKSDDPSKIKIFYHDDSHKFQTRGYLRREDPLFFEKLRENLILSHDIIQDVTNCMIKYTFEETKKDREAATNQNWWEKEKGKDL